jgi:hypothetical protein
MELLLANIALERGLITPALFLALVVMTVATTAAAGPLFDRLRPGATADAADAPDTEGLWPRHAPTTDRDAA